MVDREKRSLDSSRLVTLFFSLFFAMIFTIGSEVYKSNKVDRFIDDIPYVFRTIGITAGLSVMVYFLIEKVLLVWINHRRKVQLEDVSKKPFLLIWFLIFISWLPAFFAYYPGILTYDSNRQTRYVLGLEENSRYHPPLHTLIWKACINIENVTKIPALTIYGISQMVLLSMAMSYMLFVMRKYGNDRLGRILSFVYIAFNPAIAIMSLVMTKDILFTAVLTILVMRIFIMQEDPQRFFSGTGNLAGLFFLCVLSCLLRNNMIYALMPAFLLIAVINNKYRKKLFLVIVFSCSCYCLIYGPVYNAIGIHDGKPAEILGVPLQQVAGVAISHDEGLSSEEKKAINNFLPYDLLQVLYNPRFVDPVKLRFDSSYYIQHKIDFVTLWWTLFEKYPVEYINAFLALNIPYWYLGAFPIDPFSKRQFIETDNYELEYYPVERVTKAPALLEFYETFAKLKLPVPVEFLFSLAIPIWLILLCMTLLIRLHRCKYASCLFLHFFLWLTYMAGPVSNFRYIFPIFVAYPFFMFLVLRNPLHNLKKSRL